MIFNYCYCRHLVRCIQRTNETWLIPQSIFGTERCKWFATDHRKYVVDRRQAPSDKQIELATQEQHSLKPHVLPPAALSSWAAIRARRNENISTREIEDVTDENQFDLLAEVVTPLWKIPYNEQLKIKYTRMRGILMDLLVLFKEFKCEISSERPRGMVCALEPIRASPIQNHYRNKDEFSINRGVDGDPKTVGFFVGRHQRDGGPVGVLCVRGNHLVITKESHKLVAQHFEEFIKSSNRQVCYNFKDGGNWRNICVRSNRSGDLMATVIFHPQQLSNEDILKEQKRLKAFFVGGPGKACNLKSLYFQRSVHSRATEQQAPYELLHGEPYLCETMNGLTFRISPGSFFQTNTLGAEILCDVVQDVSFPESETTLLDICCGTGILGLSVAKKGHSLLGIDVVKQAVQDAAFNAKNNGISNAKFYSGRAQDLLLDMLDGAQGKDVVAIANPTGDGLHMNVIGCLRRSKTVHRLIYISCKPAGRAILDFQRLCAPTGKYTPGKPYVLSQAIPVDMFPHTNHCELVLVFDHLT